MNPQGQHSNQKLNAPGSSSSSSMSDQTSEKGPLPNASREVVCGEPKVNVTEDLERQKQDDAPPYTVFSALEKNIFVVVATTAAMFSPLTATIYYPALNQLSADFHVTPEVINVTIVTYMIFQGLAPTFVGGFADQVGRRPAYLVCFTIYIAACVGCALVPSFVGLLILRMVQSSGSSGTMSLASGVASDISVDSERGKYLGWAISGSMFGPAIGPILGGLLAQYFGWRAIFWFLAAFGGAVLAIIFVFYPETGRNIVGNGSVPAQPWNMSIAQVIKAARRRRSQDEPAVAATTRTPSKPLRFPNPIATLKVLKERDVALVLYFNSIHFAAYYQLQASLPPIFKNIYGYNDLQIGLCFIPFGVGCLVAPVATGLVMDWSYRRVAAAAGILLEKGKATKGDMPLEKARIPVLWPTTIVSIVALIIYGWLLHSQTHVAGPLVWTFFMGFTFTATFQISSVMVVDYYPHAPATATAAVNLCRCLLGAGAVGVITFMVDSMGVGWCFTFIALILLISGPCLTLLSRFGPGWREQRRQLR